MAKRTSQREYYYFYNNLTGIIKELENKYTTIDLQNESAVTGKIVFVDGFMNIDLEDVIFYDARGGEIPFESFFIRARNIRYVHIPIDVSISDKIKSMGIKTKKPVRNIKPRTFKLKRAQRKHQETLAELATTSKDNITSTKIS